MVWFLHLSSVVIGFDQIAFGLDGSGRPSISSIRKFLVQKKVQKNPRRFALGPKKRTPNVYYGIVPLWVCSLLFFWPTFLVGSPYFDAFLLYRIHFMKGQKQKFRRFAPTEIFKKNFLTAYGGRGVRAPHVLKGVPPPYLRFRQSLVQGREF